MHIDKPWVAEVKITKIKLWQSLKQKKHTQLVTGEDVYDILKRAKLLQKCLNGEDLLFYQENPYEIPQNWWGKRIYAFAGELYVDEFRESYVPYLNCIGNIEDFRSMISTEFSEIKSGGVIREHYLGINFDNKDFVAIMN